MATVVAMRFRQSEIKAMDDAVEDIQDVADRTHLIRLALAKYFETNGRKYPMPKDGRKTPVKWGDVEYKSLADCARANGVSKQTMSLRIKRAQAKSNNGKE